MTVALQFFSSLSQETKTEIAWESVGRFLTGKDDSSSSSWKRSCVWVLFVTKVYTPASGYHPLPPCLVFLVLVQLVRKWLQAFLSARKPDLKVPLHVDFSVCNSWLGFFSMSTNFERSPASFLFECGHGFFTSHGGTGPAWVAGPCSSGPLGSVSYTLIYGYVAWSSLKHVPEIGCRLQTFRIYYLNKSSDDLLLAIVSSVMYYFM